MILQKEILQKAQKWKVPPMVDKDYVLGHFLSVLMDYYKDSLVFKDLCVAVHKPFNVNNQF